MANPIPDPGNINNLEEFADLKKEIVGISDYITTIVKSQHLVGVGAMNAKNIYRDINKSLKNLIKIGDDWNNGLLKQKDILRQIRKLDNELKNLRIEEAKYRKEGNIQMEKAVKKSIENLDKQYEEIQAIQKANKELEKRIGITGTVIKALKDVPFLKDLLQIDEAVQAMNIAAKDGAGSFKVAFIGVKEALEDIFEKVSFGAMFALWVKTAIDANTETTNLAKTLVTTYDTATNIREQFYEMSKWNMDNFITTKKLLEANIKLSEILGVSKVYSADMLKQFINLTQRIGISEESAAGLAKMSTVTGKTLKSSKNDALEMSQAISSQYGVQINNKKST